jgi:AraC-like DNA-binding protein
MFYAIIGVLYCTPILWFRFAVLAWIGYPPKWIHILASVFSGALMLHLVYRTIKGWGDDLVHQRRRTRLYFLVLVFSITMIAAITELMNFEQFGLDRRTIKIACIWPAMLFAAIWLVNLDFDNVKFEASAASIEGLTERQERLIAKLNHLMAEKKYYANNGLKISDLASRLGVTEHQLRETINQHLGYKNFSAFLSSFRLSAVKAAFADPKMRDVPILTIALDSGFNSLTTFNRVFKHAEDMTPSEFRRKMS